MAARLSPKRGLESQNGEVSYLRQTVHCIVMLTIGAQREREAEISPEQFLDLTIDVLTRYMLSRHVAMHIFRGAGIIGRCEKSTLGFVVTFLHKISQLLAAAVRSAL